MPIKQIFQQKEKKTVIKPKPKIILMKIILETRNSWLYFRLASGL